MASSPWAAAQPVRAAAAPFAGAHAEVRPRLLAIDALRGLVMLLMVVDHVREAFYAHNAVTDPMRALTIEPALFFTRLTSQLCAPTFVALTGLSAHLFGQTHTKAETSLFLLKRGLFLMFLEVTVITFAWTAQHFPPTFWLQVIWCIGICMVALAALLRLPRAFQLGIGAALLLGHNLLDGIVLTPQSPFYVPWAILHQRSLIDLGGGAVAKTTYPVLPWIGVTLLGYAMGPWFARGMAPALRARRLLILGGASILAFFVLRAINIYGDKPWAHTGDSLRTVMSFLSLTKYPPSLLFLLPALGVGAILLAALERTETSKINPPLAILGGAPMFFYIMHLCALKVLYLSLLGLFGKNQGSYFGVDSVGLLWLLAAILVVPLYIPTRWFSELKQRRKDIWWLRYL